MIEFQLDATSGVAVPDPLQRSDPRPGLERATGHA